MAKKIKLVIADDHNLFRKGIAAMLNQIADFALIGEAANGQELLQLLEKIQPDIILMDLQMPIMDGVEATEQVQLRYPDIKIIVISMHEEDRFIIHLLEKGVNGYLLKDTEPKEVENSIRRVMADGFYYSDFVAKAMHRKVLTRIAPPAPNFNSKVQVSTRELEVLKLLCEGLSTLEISDLLCVSPRTVEGHRLRLLEKTGTKNTAGLVAYAFKNDLM
ncbi:MAG: DNA-binding response regulator [Runella slithyformis]|jgi:two-component system, NarL family, response regulator DegU|nr:MAG: DNA-binding response regulator [Runella slithyformis]TAE94647.1 MAG: DNA-binding response regulator [Runella slithyformis]TAF28126.1 MAG: DNA-binding response regulator [Runella slithyformis]TAF46730.1 MAG: DNA-binding response regulator [Runella slithyformis]TAF81569.1 MAG: DNA-binding response regulator [Runella slithyformis]